MEYICAEEFLKQDKKVQEVFMDWWKPSIGDLVFDKRYLNSVINCLECRSKASIVSKNKDVCYALLTESQLRQFIEDKMKCKINIENYNNSDILFRFIRSKEEIKSHMFYDCKSLLQAYWGVAVQIAKVL